jgi:hypothetical protein
MVINYMMSENEIKYRGSKSKFISNVNFVKEQRVDGNWYFLIKYLRCALMGFEKKLSNQIPF